MKKNDGYLKQISQIWEIKEKIYHETKKMDFKQYTEYLKDKRQYKRGKRTV